MRLICPFCEEERTVPILNAGYLTMRSPGLYELVCIQCTWPDERPTDEELPARRIKTRRGHMMIIRNNK